MRKVANNVASYVYELNYASKQVFALIQKIEIYDMVKNLCFWAFFPAKSDFIFVSISPKDQNHSKVTYFMYLEYESTIYMF